MLMREIARFSVRHTRNVYSLAVQYGIECVFYEMQDKEQKGKQFLWSLNHEVKRETCYSILSLIISSTPLD